jgi:type I restriction enzyme S subunit
MKAGWQSRPLDSLVTHDSPITYGVVKPGEEGDVPFVRGGDIVDGLVRIDQLRTITTTVSQQYKRTLLRGGELLMSLVGQPGQVAVASPTLAGANIARQVGLIRLQDIVDAHFLSYFLRSPDGIAGLGKFTGGSVQQVINLSDLRQVPVPLPPLDEQQRIVTLLDEAFANIATAKANAEKNLQNARELFESQRQLLLQAQDGWHEATLAELCNIKHGYAFEGEYFSDSGDHVLLTPGSFFETGGFRDRGEKTKYFTGPIPTDYVLNQGDLLVAMTEQAAGLLGSPLLVPESNRFLHNQRLGLVTGKPGVAWTNEFFFHVFNLDAVRKAIHASASGAKVRHTSPGKIGVVKVAFPGTQVDQLRIAAHVEEIEQASIALQSIYRQKLTALDDLKKSLLHQAFSGQL